jgi:hypothetical protein
MRLWMLCTSVLSLFLIFASCNLDDPTQVKIDQIITLTAEKSSLAANGVDRCLIRADLKGDTPDGQSVIFRTDAGTFSGAPAGVQAGQNGSEMTVKANAMTASVYLISSTQETQATVFVSVGAYSEKAAISFVRVAPERIVLTSNRTRIAADGNQTATLTASLVPVNNIGTVTERTRILFRAENEATGQRMPTLDREANSDNQGNAVVSLVGIEKAIVRMIGKVDKVNSLADTLSLEFY